MVVQQDTLDNKAMLIAVETVHNMEEARIQKPIEFQT
jgi:hypothetical protein